MGKVLKIGLIVAAVAINFVPGVGQAVSGAIVGLGGGTFAALGVAQAVISTVSALGLAAGLGVAAKTLGLGPKMPHINRATGERLRASIDPGTARKVVFGRTAMATDVRYQAFTGSDQEYYWQIVCLASHEVEAIEQLWLDDKLAWSSASGIGADFTGYLQVTAITEGSSGNVQSIDSNWGPSANTRLTGCAYLSIRFKLTGNSKKTESPFASSIPSRMTVVGKGMKVYDPRLDTTAGGSGSHRADDQTTWEYTNGTDIGRNPALQMLAWLLGWRINGKLAVGRGVPAARIDLDSFIAAANLCEEAVSLSAGGAEPRYCFDGIFAEDEDGGSVLTAFSASMAGVLRDSGGKLALSVLHDDLASPVMTLTEADVIGPFDWQQTQQLDQHRNVVRGKYTDPSSNSLYQQVDYPQASITATDGIDRILTLDLPGVQSVTQAQRLAKQALQRIQYGGIFTCTLNARAWGLLIGDVVEWETFTPLGWSNKLMRLVERTIRPDGVSDCVFADENAAIYAWSTGDEQTPVTPSAAISYDWTKAPWQQANIEDDADVTLRITGAAKSTVACDYTGTAKTGQLTKTITFALIRGTAETDETASATWSCAITSGDGTVANNATAGKVDLSVINTDRIEITVTAIYGSSERTFVHVVEKLIDPTPVGGGGSGGSSASDSTIANTTSSSYGTVHAGTLTVTAGSNGRVDLSFPGSFTRTTNGAGTAFGKWQWRVVGGTYADVATEIASIVSSNTNVTDGTYDAGSIYVSQQKTGLTAGTAYEFVLLLRNGGSYTQNWTGTASAVGS